MGNQSHLEKMGRELKCPICLSLLNSAVSLTCNHVFCNSTPTKSMKSGSDCPVCKVSFRRREVRPAPHMDSLVSTYKSMEAASGFQIFVTQNPSSTKSSETPTQPEKLESRSGANIKDGSKDSLLVNKENSAADRKVEHKLSLFSG